MNNQTSTAMNIVKALQKHNHTAVFAGGCVRDQLMGLIANDIDVATSATPTEVREIFPSATFVGESFAVVLVNEVEVATFRTESGFSNGRHPDDIVFSKSMKEDASRRDFTINAMFLDPVTDELFDFFGGQEDIQNKLIRAVGDPHERFREDYLRIMRGIRFSHRFNFDIEENTMKAVRDEKQGLKKLSGERIRQELLKTFSLPNRLLGTMLLSNIFDVILPEVDCLKDCEQGTNWHSEGNVLIHTMLVIFELDKAGVEDPILFMAALLHDVGKPSCAIRVSKEKVSFHNHDEEGVRIATDVLFRLRFPKKEALRILFVIQQHMRMHRFNEMKLSKRIRLFHEEFFDDLFKVSMADNNAAIPLDDENKKLKAKQLQDVEMMVNDLVEHSKKEKPLVNGADLIHLGFKPGPLFREILDTVFDMQLEGEKDKDKLIEFIKNLD